MLAFAFLAGSARGQAHYEDLTALFADWRAFEQPALRDGAPDYTAATMARQHEELKRYQARLAAIDTEAWTIAQQVDYQVTISMSLCG